MSAAVMLAVLAFARFTEEEANRGHEEQDWRNPLLHRGTHMDEHIPIDREDWRLFLKDLDINPKDGKISHDEVKVGVQEDFENQFHMDTPQEALDIIDAGDKDNNGHISRKELDKIIVLMEPITLALSEKMGDNDEL